MSHKAKPPMSAPQTREEILSLVRSGKMTCEEAEQWAARSGEILSLKPNVARFIEPLWTLPMVAAWIIERSWSGPSADWGYNRSEYRIWTNLGDDDELLPGFDLVTIKPRTLFEVLEKSIKHDTPVKPAIELCFALGSGQLRATGLIRNDLAHRQIRPGSWRGPYSLGARAKHHDAIYAIDLDENLFRDVLVERNEVLGIWAPLNGVGPVSSPAPVSEIEPAAIYPPGFDNPEWTVEHVLAWIQCPKIESLRRRECLNPDRPRWYGQMYRGGFVNSAARNTLWSGLLTGRLTGARGEHPLRSTWWHGKSVQDAQAVWFLRDQVRAVWRAPAGQRKGAPTPPAAWHTNHAEADSAKPPETPKQMSPMSNRRASRISTRPSAPDDIAAWLLANFDRRPSLTVDQIRTKMKAEDNEHLAAKSPSSFARAFRKAWPSDSSN
jgi:hypothetical protein